MRSPRTSAALDLWQRGHESMPRAIARAPSGVVLALVVSDTRAELARLRAAGVPVIAELCDEPWGQRHFIIADPSGFLIDVVERIEPRVIGSRPTASFDPQRAQHLARASPV